MLDINSLTTDYKSTKTNENASSGGNFLQNFVKMPEGKGSVVMRILPPAPKGMFDNDENPFYQATRIHKVNGKSLHDPRVKVNGRWVGENPIGDYLKWLWKESEKQSSTEERDKMQKTYRQLKPIERYYFNVIVRAETDESGNVNKNVGPKILSVGKTVFEAVLRGIVGDEEMNQKGYGDVTDFKTGRDFKLVKTIRKSGESAWPNYESSHFLDESPAGDPDECKAWMENLHDLSSLRTLKTPEELEHELMIHLGLKQDTNSGFDPTKFQAKENTTQTQSSVTTTTEEEETPAPVAAATTGDSSGDDDMADQDFLEELRKLSD